MIPQLNRNHLCRKQIIICLLCFKYLSLWGQPTVNLPTYSLQILFYNVENLFDTIDDPKKEDQEFLPSAARNWNSYKFRQKIQRISKVLLGCSGWNKADIIGFCEIENAWVLRYLSEKSALYKEEYQCVHFESPDIRGIDVGLLYHPKMTLLHEEAIPVVFPDHSIKTRDILYAKLENGKDTFHIFVNHWPSRRGGQEQSEYKRLYVSDILKQRIDSISMIDSTSFIICMGDFNDGPENNSTRRLLNDTNHLENLMEPLPIHFGSHKHKGVWEYLDQFIVRVPKPNGELQKTTYSILADVCSLSWLLEKESRYTGYKPKRNWKGTFFTSGFSDHLPIRLRIEKRLLEAIHH